MSIGQQDAEALLSNKHEDPQEPSAGSPQAVPASQVQATLLNALTNGRTRMAKPVVLPVVDRGRFIPSPPGIVVEDLELCSEPEHPHGQGWVPLRLMWKQAPSVPAHSSTATTQQLPSAANTSAASLVVSSDADLHAPLVAAPAVVSAIRSAMCTTQTSLEAARKVARASRAPDDHASADAQPAVAQPGSDTVEQPAVGEDVLTQAQLQSLAVKTQSRAQLHAEERSARQLHDVLNARITRPRLRVGQTAWQAPGCAPVEAQEQSEEWTEEEEEEEEGDAGLSMSAGQAEQQPHARTRAHQQGASGVVMRRPVVILLHATGADMNRLRSEQEACAIAGYLAVTLDCRYHGARCVPSEGQTKRDVYQAALARAWRDAHTQSRAGGDSTCARPERPFLLDNLWDLIHVLDYLETRSDVDIQRVGITGVSLGGMHSLLLAAVEPRIGVAAPMIGVQDFGWAIQHNQWQGRVDSVPHLFAVAAEELGVTGVNSEVVQAVWQLLLPGMLESYDAPMLLNAISPKPLCIVNGQLDPRCPMPGVVAAFEQAQQIYLSHYLHTFQPDLLQLAVAPEEAVALPTPQPSLEPTPEPSPEASQQTLDAPCPDPDTTGVDAAEGDDAGGEQLSGGDMEEQEPGAVSKVVNDEALGDGAGSTGAPQAGEVLRVTQEQLDSVQAEEASGGHAGTAAGLSGETSGQGVLNEGESLEDLAGVGDEHAGVGGGAGKGEDESQGGEQRSGVGMFLTAAEEDEVVGAAGMAATAPAQQQQQGTVDIEHDDHDAQTGVVEMGVTVGESVSDDDSRSAEGGGVLSDSATQSGEQHEGKTMQGDGSVPAEASAQLISSDGDGQDQGALKVPVNTLVGPADRESHVVVDHQVLLGKLGKEAGKRAAAAAWVNERLVLYVEPGAGHEEKPGMWSAVRSFLDLHLRGVRRGPAFTNRIASSCHKGLEV